MMEGQITYQPLGAASVSERAEFIRKTYTHVALAVLSFILLELLFFATGVAEVVASTLLAGRWTWLIVLGVFIPLQRRFLSRISSTNSFRTTVDSISILYFYIYMKVNKTNFEIWISINFLKLIDV